MAQELQHDNKATEMGASPILVQFWSTMTSILSDHEVWRCFFYLLALISISHFILNLILSKVSIIRPLFTKIHTMLSDDKEYLKIMYIILFWICWNLESAAEVYLGRNKNVAPGSWLERGELIIGGICVVWYPFQAYWTVKLHLCRRKRLAGETGVGKKKVGGEGV
ncbi:hypothetical protein GLAREA_09378 [Glarea lozoyensis ATCC 20868]|uniref:Transmembrane protein n=1 Tax=Glarea lozoyensis (strain ATCC 20868 / MF5171) TaxID=1116229 RepID=S3DP80_GLAL2|nr:uncharacterized protein GLAREA_09378 [Glarea lozoyensis ATCC 20868]EPE28258.1 hypothetical protein GLAREA_09378 [Glarea lozoyensis ATCC 20868]